jgi:hypothetical protein
VKEYQIAPADCQASLIRFELAEVMAISHDNYSLTAVNSALRAGGFESVVIVIDRKSMRPGFYDPNFRYRKRVMFAVGGA